MYHQIRSVHGVQFLSSSQKSISSSTGPYCRFGCSGSIPVSYPSIPGVLAWRQSHGLLRCREQPAGRSCYGRFRYTRVKEARLTKDADAALGTALEQVHVIGDVNAQEHPLSRRGIAISRNGLFVRR
ncbi:hypothetical protein EVAR_60567_1 [Eumeta japonica]|uniref:Uncharacterized protein n=1 Tax=Eumeta variegata TaxID=151549 RepID=A0A4C1YJ33_EUMVA|nr:hypothetical protein EVAR_60567_1 [Eumeta japonica]